MREIIVILIMGRTSFVTAVHSGHASTDQAAKIARERGMGRCSVTYWHWSVRDWRNPVLLKTWENVVG